MSGGIAGLAAAAVLVGVVVIAAIGLAAVYAVTVGIVEDVRTRRAKAVRP